MLNSIAIQGRLVHTPEAKVTKSGKDVCTFSIACDRQSGGQKARRSGAGCSAKLLSGQRRRLLCD